MHINCLETLAIKFAVSSLLYLYRGIKHVRIMSDNATAISYVNKQGGTHSVMCNDIAVEIWEIYIGQGVHTSAAHIPAVHNILADKASRHFEDASEWMLSTSVFSFRTGIHGTPDIDLFAFRLNKQLPVYASWMPDPESTHIDAMFISWSGKYIYLFI